MNIIHRTTTFIIAFILMAMPDESKSCSMYKLTVDDKTMVGCNEDAWRTTPRIWFENAKSEHKYGAGFTGSRQVSADQFAPQSGMNEAGLVFSRLASYAPKKDSLLDRKKIINEVAYLTDILHQCATIEEVKRYIEQYDHSFFINDVFIYVDKSGKYLVVEPYETIQGNDPSYVLSNFCPSITDSEKARNLERYRNGKDFLSLHKIDTSLQFCSALSDTMHVCRKRNGDGTLLTSIWDSKNGLVNLYFYHNYASTVQFNLREELEKGDHILNIVSLFPIHPEFERLSNYKTPFNTPSLRIALVMMAGVLSFLSVLFFILYWRRKNPDKFHHIFVVFLMLNILLAAYLIVLATNINIYYFDAPYQHYSSNLLSISSYIPLVLLLIIAPLIAYLLHFTKHANSKSWLKTLFVFNTFIFMVFILGFGYWGLLEVFN